MPPSTASLPLKDIVFFIVQESPYEIGITKLMKLVFLADIEHVQLYGERLCDIDWAWYIFGPFSPCVYAAVETLDTEGFVHDALVVNHCAIEPSDVAARTQESMLEARHRYTLRRVLSRYGHLTLSAIKQVAYATQTMLQAEPNSTLDVLQEPRRSLADSSAALSTLLERTSEPDNRSWGNSEESASEDLEILKELAEQRRAANQA